MTKWTKSAGYETVPWVNASGRLWQRVNQCLLQRQGSWSTWSVDVWSTITLTTTGWQRVNPCPYGAPSHVHLKRRRMKHHHTNNDGVTEGQPVPVSTAGFMAWRTCLSSSSSSTTDRGSRRRRLSVDQPESRMTTTTSIRDQPESRTMSFLNGWRCITLTRLRRSCLLLTSDTRTRTSSSSQSPTWSSNCDMSMSCLRQSESRKW